ncbi:1-deoxy-D-xylulose-5-phosphate synthase [bacterium]|nr:1-deoxy-D-xylulose-5-phosphate synthase [bacterium]
MYIEYKGGALAGPARIGRVTFSQSRKTIYYGDCKLKSLKGRGYKANYYDSANGGRYWVSNCQTDGQDTLYPGTVEIDDDAREEYWTEIRKRPDLVERTSYRSEGKYSKRRPQPEKPNHHATGPRS